MYILYLQKQANAADDALVILSGYNGKVNINHPKENEAFPEIVSKTIEEYVK